MSEPLTTRPAVATFTTTTSARTCLNCGTALGENFCGTCGQAAATGRLTLRALLHEAFAQLIELDHGLLHTFIDLLKNPGSMLRGYIAGRRRKYTGPVTFVVLASTLSILQTQLVPGAREAIQSVTTKTNPDAVKALGSAFATTYPRIIGEVVSNKFLLDASLMLPLMLAIRWLFRKRGINLAEAGVFSAYTLGEATFVTVPILFPFYLLRMPIATKIGAPIMIATAIYTAFGMFGRSFSTAWRIAMALFLGFMGMTTAVLIATFWVTRT